MAPTRRQFILGASATALLAACSDSGSGTKSTTAGTQDGTLPDKFSIVQRFPSTPLFTTGPIRLPVSLSDGTNLLNDGPSKLPGWIEDVNQKKVVDIVGVRRKEGIAVPYWEVRVAIPDKAIYYLRFEGDDGNGAAFETFDASQVQGVATGTAMPGFDTPTVSDHRGVEPYCSLTPDPCPLHDVTLTDALKSGKPVAYMIGTPAHCQTGTCAPGLEFLVAEHERLKDQWVMVHADVYADDAATKVAPAVEALKIDYEPIIYFIDAKGIVVDRLDGVWNAEELRERFSALGF